MKPGTLEVERGTSRNRASPAASNSRLTLWSAGRNLVANHGVHCGGVWIRQSGGPAGLGGGGHRDLGVVPVLLLLLASHDLELVVTWSQPQADDPPDAGAEGATDLCLQLRSVADALRLQDVHASRELVVAD
eukprot:2971225-Prymnesium_polylepis.2